jgi:cytochrome oxidase Cu insertion factor (SCO1/SenC/PrrC family)
MALPRPLVLTFVLMGLCLLGLGAGAWLGATRQAREDRIEHLAKPDKLGHPEFRLHDCNGAVVTERSHRGQVVLLYFGYTYCPDVCPTEMGFLARVLHDLGPADAARVVPLFVIVDPERDTPEQLRGYVALFDPRIQALTGSPAYLIAAATAFGAAFDRYTPAHAAPNAYLINHTSATYILDQNGALVGSFDHFDQVPRAVTMIRAVLHP